MRSSSVQIIKEARQLAWPWTILMFAGLAVLTRTWMAMGSGTTLLLWRGWEEWILPVGTFFGALLLATLPMGSEFQFRTLPMRFAQPLDRRHFWRQKFVVTLLAVIPPAIIYCAALGMRFGRASWVMAAGWIVLTTAGAIPFTLLARSTVGGMMLNTLGTTIVVFAWMYYQKYQQIPPLLLVGLGIWLVGYSAVMIWLGRRMILRFQAVDGMQAGETFVPGARLLPSAVAEWFRCRPGQPWANLVRREVRLLRSLWPLALLNLAAWIGLVAFRQLPTEHPDSVHAVFVVTLMFGLLIAVLAGTLSLGEEKTWGTHEWHMTVPISLSAQWAVKLFAALFTSVVCGALLPMLVIVVGGWITRTPWPALNGSTALLCVLEVAFISFAAFWCSCVVRGTVQATMWIFPVFFAVMFCANAPWALAAHGPWFEKLIAYLVSLGDPVGLMRKLSRVLYLLERDDVRLIAFAPLLAAALIQSRRLFGAQFAANRLRVVRCALPLMCVAFLCGLMSLASFQVLSESWRQQSTIIRETDNAIAALQSADSHPRVVSADELTRGATLSAGTQRWLRAATITVAFAPERLGDGPGQYFPGRTLFAIPASRAQGRTPYSAVVRTASGTQCSLLFQIKKAGDVGFLTAICE